MGFCLLFFFNTYYIYIFLSLEMILLGVLGVLVCGIPEFFGFSVAFSFVLVLVCMGGFSISLLVFLSRESGKDFWFSGGLI